MPGLLQQPPSLTPAFEPAAAWRDAPAALAVVSPQGVLAWNQACAQLLRETVGSGDDLGRRWLCAAVARLLACDKSADVMSYSQGDEGLAVQLGAPLDNSEARVVSLARSTGDDAGQESLAATVSTLSHELRTPLTSMKSSLGIVASGEAGPITEDQTHFLGMTLRNIDRLERLVNDLLDVSRSGPQGVAPQRREIDLGPLLREAAQMHAAAAAEAGLDLDFTGLPEVLWAHVDPDQLLQILGNILGNALKYTPDGGLVRVWLESRPQSRPESVSDLAVQLSERLGLKLDVFSLVVENSGPGLSREDLERVFEPWYRCGGTGENRAPGAGLGLTITRSLVEAHGGRIRLASEPGQGTSVWVRLPRDPASEQLMRGARQLSATAERAGRKMIALLDGRGLRAAFTRPLTEIVRDCQNSRPEAAVGDAAVVAEDVVGLVVADTAAWAAAWDAYGRATGANIWPGWDYLAWSGSTGNEGSTSGLVSRIN